MRLIGRFIKFAVLAILIFGCGSIGAKSPDADKSDVGSFIKSVKQYSKTIKFKETDNFKEYSEAGEHIMYYHEITDVPFSALDPKMKWRRVTSSNFKEAVHSLKKDIKVEQKDFYFYPNIVYAGKTKITPAITKRSRLSLAEVVLHEDWHNNAGLPRHIEEASAVLIGTVGAYQFLNREAEIDAVLKSRLEYHETIDFVHYELETLSMLLELKKINMDTYLKKRKKVIEKNLHSGHTVTDIVFRHTYAHYFPLMYKLYYATGKDLKKTTQILLKIPRKVKKLRNAGASRSAYFKATRDAEFRIEAYLEEVILELNNNK